MKSIYLLLLLMALAIGCTSEPAAAITEPETAVPTKEATATATATSIPTHTASPMPIPPTPTATMTETTSNTATPTETPAPKAISNGDGFVYLNDSILVDIQKETGCFADIPAEIIYSPDEAHFLVIVLCFEGDNHLFLFEANGDGKRLLTQQWGVLNGLNVTWAEDSQSFTFERIQSCCASPEDIPQDAPPRGDVQVFVDTNEQRLVATPELP